MYGGTRFVCANLKQYSAGILLFAIATGLLEPFFNPFRVEGAEVTLDSTASTVSTSHIQSGSQTVFIDDQTGYKFYRDAGGYCVYRKTTNGGATWSASTTVDSQTDCIQITVWYDRWTPGSASSSIHILTADTGDDSLFYNRLDPNASDALLLGSTPVNITANSGQAGSLTEGENYVALTRGTDGTVYAVSNDGSGLDNDSYVVECTVTCSVAGNWSETGFNPLDIASDYNILLPLAAGSIMLINRDISADDIRYKIWNNTSWSVLWTAIDADAPENTTYDTGIAASVSSTTPGIVYLAYLANVDTLGTDDEVRTARFDGSSWILTADVLTSTTRGLTNVALALDSASDQVYVAYAGRTTSGTANTAEVYWKSATSSMMNWSSESGPVNTAANDFYGLDLNIASDERLFASWFDATDFRIGGDTIADIYPGIHATGSGSQVGTVGASTTDFYVGGSFVFTNTYTPRAITGITITEGGTIDGSADITNIRLFYENDTSYPYTCASESYNGTEQQFGSTDTNGFSEANGSSTFTGTSVSVSTTSALCIYTVLDIKDTPLNGATLDLHIQNPATDVTVTNWTVQSTTSVVIPGTTSIVGAIPTQAHYHWRLDNGSETTALSATQGNEDVPVTNVSVSTPLRIRMEVSNEGVATSSLIAYQLEYGTKITSCNAISAWTDVGEAGGDFDMYDSPNISDSTDTTNIAVTNGGVTDENTIFKFPNAALVDTSSSIDAIRLSPSEFLEAEFSIKQTTNASYATTYCFRLTAAGIPLSNYSTYPELTTSPERDFEIQRGTALITGTSTTLVAGVDYVTPNASTSAFMRITNTHHTGAGSTVGGTQTAADVTAYLLNPSNIPVSVTIARPPDATGNTRVSWEIVEFIGEIGSDNEVRVRNQSTVTYGDTERVATGTAALGIVDDADVVVFITGQLNPDPGTSNYNTGQSTASWGSTGNVPVFTRGEAGGVESRVSYAVVEFIGQNWSIQRSEHTYTATGTAETEAITAVNSLSRTFIHTQKRGGSGLSGVDEFGHEVWLSSIGFVSYLLETDASNASDHTSVVWIIENTQTSDGSVDVTRSNGSSNGGTEPLTLSVAIGKTLSDLSNASIFINSRSASSDESFPRPIAGVTIASTTHYEVWRSDTGANLTYRTEIVEWPTAGLTLRQNYYRFYVDNNALDPTDPWPSGPTDLGENTILTELDEPLGAGERVRIRMSIHVGNATFPTSTRSFKLQYAPLTTTCSAISDGNWVTLGDAASSTAWRGYNGAGTTDGTVLSTNPPSLGDLNLSVSDVAGTLEEINNSSQNPYSAPESADVEYDWIVEQHDASADTYYCFRMVEADGTRLGTYLQYPQIKAAGFVPRSQNWRWFEDEENATPSVSLGLENTAPVDVAYTDTIVLRVTVQETKNTSRNDVRFKLQYSEYADFSVVADVTATTTCSIASAWCYAEGAGVDNDRIDALTLTDPDACSGGVGAGCGTYNESPYPYTGFTHQASAAAEYSFTLEAAAPRVNTVYYFRLYDIEEDTPVLPNDDETYPSLVTEGSSLVFTVSGVNESTVVEGVTTDVTTTAIAVPYGTLSLNSDTEAAHRLQVSTNAPEGYQIYMMTSSDLSNSSGSIIPPISSTNSSPASWSSGCDADALGCFGYHAGDDTLEGGSTRFAANDTYARFSTTTLDEVVYSGGPAANDTIDMVYRVKARALQQAGQYTTSVRYITVPVF